VVPVYNEGENILDTIGQIESKISTPHHIFIVYDFDEDNTLPAVNRFIMEHHADNITFVKNKYGNGVLKAIRTGFDVADGIVLVIMADSSDDLSVVDAMYRQIKAGYDIVCGSRYVKGGAQVGGPRLKGLFSRMAGLSLRWITGIPTHDISNSFKMYRKSVLNTMTIESRGGFEIGMEIVVKAFLQGYRITEVPSMWRDRTAGKSRFKLMKWAPEYLRWYFYAVCGRLLNRRKQGTG
jgi:glycosyltransferase involved in cell wall biosynthesis